MSLLRWESCPVLLLAAWIIVEIFPLVHRPLRQARGWKVTSWFFRPLAVWGVYNIIYRYFESYGFNDRTTFPFAFVAWEDNLAWMVFFRQLARSSDFWIWSTVVLLLGALFAIVCRWIMSEPMGRKRTTLALTWLVLLNITMPLAYNCLPGGVHDPLENKGSFLHAWFESGHTMLYCMPHVVSKSHYLKHFQEIQPAMTASIHGVSHPPLASLVLYWAGKPFGATGNIPKDRIRYCLGTTVFAALGVLAMFFLGRTTSGSNGIGLMSAALWAVKPATLAYNTFAADPTYSVFNLVCLAFIWQAVTKPQKPWFSLVALGVTLYVLTLLNFNWILFAGIFGSFLTIHSRITRRTLLDWFVRASIPAAIMFGLLIATCIEYHIDYLAIYRFSWEYTGRFYHMTGAYQWIMALLGSPLDLFLLCGSVTAYLFWRMFPIVAKRSTLEPLIVFILTILAVYLVTAISVNILKIESSRVWAWATALPLVFVARSLHRSDHPRFYFLMAVILAMLQYYAMQLYLTPCG